MTTYKKAERRQWRHALKRFQWRINYALAMLAFLATILVQPAPVSARSCDAGWRPIANGCRLIGGSTVACNPGYQGQFSRVAGRFVGKCVPGPKVIKP